MLIRSALPFLLCLFCIQMGLAQDLDRQRDSLLNVLEATDDNATKVSAHYWLAQLDLYTHPQNSAQLCRELIAFCEQIDDHNTIAAAYTLLFNAQLYYGAPADTLFKTIQRYEQHVDRHLEEPDLVNVYWIYALYYDNLKQADKEIEYYIRALGLARKHEQGASIGGALLGNIGNVLMNQDRHEEAKVYLEQSLALAGDAIGKGSVKHSLGLVFREEGAHELSLKTFQESYDLFAEGQDYKGMALALIEQGVHYDRIGFFEEANRIFISANDLIERNDVGSVLPFLYVTLAKHYQARGDFRTAVQFAEQALSESERQQSYDNLETTFTVLHECYAKLGSYQKAYEIRGQELVFRDSVNSAELRTNVEALRTQFEVEQKESENQLLKAQAATDQKRLQNRNITALALLLGCLLLFSWAFTVYRASRQKEKYNEELAAKVSARTADLEEANKNLRQANYELNTFNHIASHDIKEPMRNIGNHVGLIYRMLPEDIQPKFRDYFDTVRLSTAQLYTVIEDFSKYIQLSKDEDFVIETVDLNTIVDNVRLGLDAHNDQDRFTIVNKGLPSIKTNASIVYIVLKNIIENGLKFNSSSNPTVEISARSQDGYTEVLVKLLLNKLGGSISLESEVNVGSTFILRLPE